MKVTDKSNRYRASAGGHHEWRGVVNQPRPLCDFSGRFYEDETEDRRECGSNHYGCREWTVFANIHGATPQYCK
jgi:hypothetical protein